MKHSAYRTGATQQYGQTLTFGHGGLLSRAAFGEEKKTMRRMAIIFVLALAAAAGGQAQNAPVQTTENKVVVLRAARLFDGKSNSLVTPGVVIVANGKISAEGANGTIPAG